MRVCVNLCRVFFCLLTGTSYAGAQVSAPVDTSELVIRHDVHSPVSLSPGDTLAVHLTLLNSGVRPVRISWGARMFVLDALFMRSRVSKSPIDFPPVHTWGKVEHWEYPNPYAVYLSWRAETTLASGKAKTADFRIPFDSIGTYSIKVCIDLVDRDRICRPRDISVIVK
jgi:hypothetical protein